MVSCEWWGGRFGSLCLNASKVEVATDALGLCAKDNGVATATSSDSLKSRRGKFGVNLLVLDCGMLFSRPRATPANPPSSLLHVPTDDPFRSATIMHAVGGEEECSYLSCVIHSCSIRTHLRLYSECSTACSLALLLFSFWPGSAEDYDQLACTLTINCVSTYLGGSRQSACASWSG
jgi:hypothetical protein